MTETVQCECGRIIPASQIRAHCLECQQMSNSFGELMNVLVNYRVKINNE